ncbi:MAG TPA: mechanosensitive ion channel [Candidatus Omnitrophota bacterium]|nr:mechanosensitive ion channel [Candidatus Omnitrophota bacterium]HPN56020.1 mechanosensitive ion channel [Candidatus Omnitrophota bacterium]
MQVDINQLQTLTVTYVIRIVAAIVIFFVGRIIASFISTFVKKLMLKAKVDVTLAGFVQHLSFMGIMVFVIIAALNKLGVETTSMVAVIGAAGLAVGLALQGSLANFAAGVMLVIFKPFGVGDFINAAGEMGTVKEIQIFNTVLAHPDNRKIVVPNSHITGGSITNFSAIENRRVDLQFGISYGDDMKKAKDVLMNLVASDARVLKDPAPVVAVSELGESSVNLVCRPWVKPGDYWAVYFDVVEKGKLALQEAGITIPFPQSDVHLYNGK